MSILRSSGISKDMIFAQGVTHRLSLKSSFNDNVMVVGASGRGKTRQYVKANIMQMNNNYVVSDPNGHLVQELGTMLQNNGYFVQVLNFADMTKSEHYNPMHYLRKESDVFTFIDYLMFSINEHRKTKDFLGDNAAAMLISAIMFYLMEECNDDDQNLSSVLMLLRCYKVAEYIGDKSTLDVMMEDLREKDPEHIAVKQYAYFKKVASSQNVESSIVATALVYMQHFLSPDLMALTSQNTVDFDSLSIQRSALFIVTSDADRSKDWLYNLFFYQLFDYLCKRECNCHAIHFLLDNFTIAGKILDFEQKFAAFRGHFLSASIVLQDEAQLEQAYGPAAARSIISNCDHYVFMGSDNIDLCEKVAQRTGKRTITGAKLRRLPRKKCVVISGSHSGIYYKYKLEKHPHYKEIIDKLLNPMMNVQAEPLLYDIFKNLSYNTTNKKTDKQEIPRELRKYNNADIFRTARNHELRKPIPLAHDIPLVLQQSEKSNREETAIVHEAQADVKFGELQDMSEEDLAAEQQAIANMYFNSSLDPADCESLGSLLTEPFLTHEVASIDSDNKNISFSQKAWDIGNSLEDDVTAVLVDEADGFCLYIRGTGKTKNYYLKNYIPWYPSYRFDIKRLVVSQGVTVLGNYLFADLPCLQKAEIASSVYSFGSHLFSDCNSLYEVIFQSPLNIYVSSSISESMFENCFALKEFIFPKYCSTIEKNAFSGCSSLKQVTFSPSLKHFDPSCFSGCTSLIDVISYDISASLKQLPEHIKTFIKNCNIELLQHDLDLNWTCKYLIHENKIYFQKLLTIYDFDFILKEALAEYVYFYFSLSERSKEMFLTYRYDTYRLATKSNSFGCYWTDQQIDSIFANDLNHFKTFFFSSLLRCNQRKMSVLACDITSYGDFIQDVHTDIIVKNYEAYFVEVIRELLGDEQEKKLTLKEVHHGVINRTGEELSNYVFRVILNRLVEQKVLRMVYTGSRYIFSLGESTLLSETHEKSYEECIVLDEEYSI